MSRRFALCWVFRCVLVQWKAASSFFSYLRANREGFLHSQPSHVEGKEGKKTLTMQLENVQLSVALEPQRREDMHILYAQGAEAVGAGVSER